MAFLAFCVAPTVATAAWIGGHYAPGRKGRIARQLGSQLQAQVKLADWRTPRPGAVHSRQMSVYDAASGALLAELAGFERRDGRSLRLLAADEAVIDAAQLPRLVERVERWLAALPPYPHELRARRIVFAWPAIGSSRRFALAEAQGRVDRDGTGRVRLQLVGTALDANGVETGGAIRLVLESSASPRHAAATLTLDASQSALPADLLATLVPGFGRFGHEAMFQGTIRWTSDGDAAVVNASGRLEEVDFAAVLPLGSPHRLQGAGMVELHQWRWRNGRIDRLAGAIQARAGQMSRSLLLAAVNTLACQPTSEQASDGEGNPSVAFDQLAFRFELGPEGLLFFGACPPTASGLKGYLATTAGGEPLLVEPDYESLRSVWGRDFRYHLACLVNALAQPTQGISLPASREAIDIAERLPFPAASR